MQTYLNIINKENKLKSIWKLSVITSSKEFSPLNKLLVPQSDRCVLEIIDDKQIFSELRQHNNNLPSLSPSLENIFTNVSKTSLPTFPDNIDNTTFIQGMKKINEGKSSSKSG